MEIDSMDEELQRLSDELEQAEREWREHRQTGYAVAYTDSDSPEIGTATVRPDRAGWREREQELWAAFQAARDAWRAPRPGGPRHREAPSPGGE